MESCCGCLPGDSVLLGVQDILDIDAMEHLDASAQEALIESVTQDLRSVSPGSHMRRPLQEVINYCLQACKIAWLCSCT